MIVDKIENASLYYSLSPQIEKALRYLENNDLTSAASGKTPVEENNVIISVSEYTTKSRGKGLLEAHRKNIDVQFMIAGNENMGFAFMGQHKETTPYDDSRDVQFFGSGGETFLLQQGMFAIFFPTDLHMPGIEDTEPANVKKAVIKVRVPE